MSTEKETRIQEIKDELMRLNEDGGSYYGLGNHYDKPRLNVWADIAAHWVVLEDRSIDDACLCGMCVGSMRGPLKENHGLLFRSFA